MSSSFDLQVSARETAVITATDGQTSIAITFPFQSVAELVIHKEAVDGTRSVLTPPSGFTATGAGSSAGGTATLVTPAAAGEKYRVAGAASIERRSDMTVAGRYNTAALEGDLDKGVIIDAELKRDVGRTVRAHPMDPALSPLPASQIARLLTIAAGGEVAVAAASKAEAEAAVDNVKFLTSLRAREGLKTASFTADVNTRGFFDGSSGAGFFAAYDCLGGAVWRPDLSASQASISGGGIRDGFAVLARDTDTTDYTAIGRKISNGARILMTGAYDPATDTWDAQAGKDIIGLDVHAIANVSGPDRGVSGIAAGAINYGTGIITNEFSVENPAAGSQSVSMAAVQPIVRPYNAADDGSHLYFGVLVSNTGHRITAAFDAVSDPISGSYNGRFRYGLNLTRATIEECAIRLGGTSASGHVATAIEYDANDYTIYDRGNNRYDWIVGGSSVMRASATALDVSGQSLPLVLFDGNDYLAFAKASNTLDMVVAGGYVGGFKAAGVYAGAGARTDTGAFLTIAAGTTASASMRVQAGAAPTSPADGDMWRIGAVLYLRAGGTTKSVTFA